MNRCSRLIEEEFINCEAATEPLFLQKGDRMTGFEIIASLPIETQLNMSGIFNALLDIGIKWTTGLMWCAALYEYSGEGWDEVKE